jgi:hypothetical protein
MMLRKIKYILTLSSIIWSIQAYSTTYTVTNTKNSGGGSFRQAIIDANANAGADIINFSIAGSGQHIITLTAVLPDITDNSGVTINGYSQSGASVNTVDIFSISAATPLNSVINIILRGNDSFPCLTLLSDNNAVSGIIFQNFGNSVNTNPKTDFDIGIDGDDNLVTGCWFEVNAAGTAYIKQIASPAVDNVVNNCIALGLISGNTSNRNRIGDATAAGINWLSGAGGGLITSSAGIQLAKCHNTVVQGNLIGPTKDGQNTFYVQSIGIFMAGGYKTTTTIGGSNAGEGNVCSGNIDFGMRIFSGDKTMDIKGNIFGPTPTGTAALLQDGASTPMQSGGSCNGGTARCQRYGLYISDCDDCIVGGDRSVGTGALGEGNLFSGNWEAGIVSSNNPTTTTVFSGNICGLDITGTTLMCNNAVDPDPQSYGMKILGGLTDATATIGGNTIDKANIFSGNDLIGIYHSASTTSYSYIGNICGLQIDGTSMVASNPQTIGMQIENSGSHFIGTANGGEGNVFSGNTEIGLKITNATATANKIYGNVIGLQKNGTTRVVSNTQNYGVHIESASNEIGSATAGEGNVISGNLDAGIKITGAAATGNKIYGNFIGVTDTEAGVTGSNQDDGVLIEAASSDNEIGLNAGEENVIAGNTSNGIRLTGANTTGNEITKNYIGIGSDQSTNISVAQPCGVRIEVGASDNKIGKFGSILSEENVITDNTLYGVYIDGTTTDCTGNTISGNYIGVSSTQANIAANGQDYGIYVDGASANNIGLATDINFANVIADNGTAGVYIKDAAATGNLVKNNFIGCNKSQTSIAGASQTDGVWVTSNANSNTIGGSGANDPNYIAYNTDVGIQIGSLTNQVLISRNLIHNNPTQGIKNNFFINPGFSGNIATPVPVISADNSVVGSVSGTGVAGNTIELFLNDAGCGDEAFAYLGSAVVDGAGDWTVTGLGVGVTDNGVATQRDAVNNTSEFSVCMVGLLPVELINFTVSHSKNFVKLNWNTASEINNDHFEIEHSIDGMHYKFIGEVDGNGNTSEMTHYKYIDTNPVMGINYYRLKQIDFDGAYEYSQIRSAEFDSGAILNHMRPNPVENEGNISIWADKTQSTNLVILNSLGQVVLTKNVQLDEGENEVRVPTTSLPAGAYFFQLIQINGNNTSLIFYKK